MRPCRPCDHAAMQPCMLLAIPLCLYLLLFLHLVSSREPGQLFSRVNTFATTQPPFDYLTLLLFPSSFFSLSLSLSLSHTHTHTHTPTPTLSTPPHPTPTKNSWPSTVSDTLCSLLLVLFLPLSSLSHTRALFHLFHLLQTTTTYVASIFGKSFPQSFVLFSCLLSPFFNHPLPSNSFSLYSHPPS